MEKWKKWKSGRSSAGFAALALTLTMAPVLAQAPAAPTAKPAPGPVKRMPDGTPDIQGMFMADAGGANYGLERRTGDALTPPARGVVVDPPDGKLPMQPWAVAEVASRALPERGYDDPTAHCFVAGVPRSMYVPSPMHILQPPGYVVILHERMSWRIIPLGKTHTLPDNVRLWQGDSVGRWEGDTLVVETNNLRGAEEGLYDGWLDVRGTPYSGQAKFVERFRRPMFGKLEIDVTVEDPKALTKPFTVRINQRVMPDDEPIEFVCNENQQFRRRIKVD